MTAQTVVIDENPIPCLLLRAREMSPWASSRDDYGKFRYGLIRHGRIGVAAPAFAYGSTIVDPIDPSDEILHRVNNTLTRRIRQYGFEQEIFKRLEEFGFRPVMDAERNVGRPFTSSDLSFPPPEDVAARCWAQFLDRSVPILRTEGWRIAIGRDFPHRIIHADSAWSAEIGDYENGWFTFGLDAEIGGQRVPLLPVIIEALRRYNRADGGIRAMLARDETMYGILPDGTFLALPPERVSAIVENIVELFDGTRLDESGKARMTIAQAIALEDLGPSFDVHWNNEKTRAFLKELQEDNAPLQPPALLHGELRPYQVRGFGWLQLLRKHEFGGILADDMGLGKTVQTLAHILAEKQAGRLEHPCLIVAPTSVVPNWAAEVKRFAPSLKVIIWQGAARSEHMLQIADVDVVITGYSLLARDAQMFLKRTWDIAVLDEAQAIKNPLAKISHVAVQLQAKQRLALTGTPMENHLEELWSLSTFAIPGLLGKRDAFSRHFRTPIEKQGDTRRQQLLNARLRPFMLRRTKAQIDEQLPEKTEIVQRFELTGKQRDLYETVRLTMHAQVREEVAKNGFQRSHFVVLSALLKLRQVCCDPRLLNFPAAKLVEESAKTELLFEMLPELFEEGRRVLLFSQFTSMLDLLKPTLQAQGIPFVELRGDTRDRETPVQRFQNREVPLFLISLKAGGTGLNLTAADTVIHYDPWWNPAVERQATDRAHRIGQTQPVFVYKLIAAGTVEDRILEMQARKGALAEALFDESTKVTFDSDDLDRLFAPIQ